MSHSERGERSERSERPMEVVEARAMLGVKRSEAGFKGHGWAPVLPPHTHLPTEGPTVGG